MASGLERRTKVRDTRKKPAATTSSRNRRDSCRSPRTGFGRSPDFISPASSGSQERGERNEERLWRRREGETDEAREGGREEASKKRSLSQRLLSGPRDRRERVGMVACLGADSRCRSRLAGYSGAVLPE
jgi:hypothetical protein